MTEQATAVEMVEIPLDELWLLWSHTVESVVGSGSGHTSEWRALYKFFPTIEQVFITEKDKERQVSQHVIVDRARFERLLTAVREGIENGIGPAYAAHLQPGDLDPLP